MRRDYRSPTKSDRFLLVFLVLLGFSVTGESLALAAPPGAQGEVAVSPGATPEVWQVKPNQAPAGSDVTFQVEGRNFAEGVRAESENPEKIKITSARRVSSSKLEVKVAISGQAPVGDAGFYVRNPQAHGTGYGGFGITAAQAPAAAETSPSEVATPEVAALNPARANQGAALSLKVTGKNFAKDAKISFSNPGITVSEVKPKATEIAARIQVARDAEAGTGGLFVTNPNGRQAESPFEVVASQAPAKPAKTTVPATVQETGGAANRYEVFNLGEGVSILQNPNKPKGALSAAGGRLRYEEAGKEVFSVASSEIKEIDANSVLGYNTGTFHVILNSGPTYNFAPASLSITDGQKILDNLKRALR